MILDRDLSFRFPLLSGDDVRAVQQALIRAGAMRSEADGVFGPLTRDAVAALQRRAGLAADGVLRRGTWDRLQPAAPPAPRPAPDWRDMRRPFVRRLSALHGPPVGSGSRRWRLSPAGVVRNGDDAPPRSPEPPRTAALASDRFREPMEAAAARFACRWSCCSPPPARKAAAAPTPCGKSRATRATRPRRSASRPA